MLNQNVLARIHLEAVLSNLEILAQDDPQTADLAKKWNGNINFVTGLTGPRASLQFKDGQIKLVPGEGGFLGIVLFFPAEKLLNNMFTGKGIGFPIPLKGFIRMKGLIIFMKLAKRMEEVLKGDSAPAELKAKLMLNTVAKTVAIIASYDEEGKELAKKAKGVAEIRVKNGYAVNVDFADGKATAKNGNAPDPDLIMEFNTNKLFLDLAEEKVDVMAAICLEDMVLSGNLGLGDIVNTFLDKVGIYLA
jgi:putative sterol carrier protein